MITSVMAEDLLYSVFIDPASKYADQGFEVSMHYGGAAEAVANEIAGMTYSRVPINQGIGYWEIGSRTVLNAVDITFPATDPSELIRGIRTLVLWGVEVSTPLWMGVLDEPGINVGGGDAVIVPAGGMVIGFG